MRCRSCKKYPATSIATGLCSYCLYAAEKGQDAAARQERLALRDKAYAKAAKNDPTRPPARVDD